MARSTEKPFTVASAQIAPVFMDRARTVDKACETIGTAAKKGAKIIVFPETFIPAYPDWIWVLPAYQEPMWRELHGELLDQSVTIPSPATDKLCKAAKSAGAYVVIGINERSLDGIGGSMYNTMLYIDDQGEIMGRHRKLVPTASERQIWMPGGGDTLQVFETPYGRLGGLICWENYMPLARYALYAWGVQIYVASTWDSSDGWVATLRHIAREGRVAVIGCCIAMTRDDIPDTYRFKEMYPPAEEAPAWVNDGNSVIVRPNGRLIAGPVAREETILYGEIDPAHLRGAKSSMDTAGHYARPDVFQLMVNREPTPMINVTGAGAPSNGKVKTTPTRTAARRKA
jgi:nitrilase